MRTYACLLLIISGCSAYTPQAIVDRWDWARERNERGIYREAMRDIEIKARSANTSMVHSEIMTRRPYPRCNINLSERDYPVTFAVPGLDYGAYYRDCNAIVYSLGDHDQLEHEFRHAIVERANLSRECLAEMFVNSPPVPLNRLK